MLFCIPNRHGERGNWISQVIFILYNISLVCRPAWLLAKVEPKYSAPGNATHFIKSVTACLIAGLINDNLHEYLELTKVAFNCPIALAVGALLPLTASMCGPDTSVKAVNYSIPLNTFSASLCTSDGAKSAFEHFVCDAAEQEFSDHGINVLLENYSFAGLHRNHIDNKNYPLVFPTRDIEYYQVFNWKWSVSSLNVRYRYWTSYGPDRETKLVFAMVN